MNSPFISVKDLYNLLFEEEKPSLVIVDTRYYLSDPKLGYQEYEREHIPGAIFADLDNDLSGPITKNSGRHPLPNLDNFVKWLTKNSITKTDQIIIYDQLGGGIASRLWLMLIHLGYNSVTILEGGIIEWKRQNFTLTNGVEFRTQLSPDYDLKLPKRWEDGYYKMYSKNEIKELIGKKVNLIDSRSPERYLGLDEPIDPIAGHIPTAKNIFWQSHLNEELKMKSTNDIERAMLEKISMKHETIFYCGSGVTAAFNVLMMKHLKLPDPGIYIGSWSEWIKE